MALSPVSRESDFKNSIKKYFLDSLETIEGIPTFFEFLDATPCDSSGNKLRKWVIVSFGNCVFGNVSEGQISVEAYTRKDSEADDLVVLLDTIRNYIIDENSINGLHTIPYYNTSVTPWTIVGGMIPFLQPTMGIGEGRDHTRFKDVNILCKWGGK